MNVAAPAAPWFTPARAGQLIALVAAATLVSVAWVRWSGSDIHTQDAPIKMQRSLRFADLPNGDIGVMDARTGQHIASFSGEQGFLRGSLRALARERKRRDIDASPPFDLLARTDGRLTLLDNATGVRLDLESFGPAQANLFAGLLLAQAAPSPTPPKD